MQVVKVTTAIEVSDTQKTKLEKSLLSQVGGAETKFEFVVDPHVLGGIKVTVGSREFDGTLRAKLEQIHERLAANI